MLERLFAVEKSTVPIVEERGHTKVVDAEANHLFDQRVTCRNVKLVQGDAQGSW